CCPGPEDPPPPPHPDPSPGSRPTAADPPRRDCSPDHPTTEPTPARRPPPAPPDPRPPPPGPHDATTAPPYPSAAEPLTRPHLHREVRQPPHRQRPALPWLRRRNQPRRPLGQHPQRHLTLQPGQRSPQAIVRTRGERQVLTRTRTLHVELFRVPGP